MLSETEQVTASSLITGKFYPVVSEDSPLTESISSELPVLYGYLGTTIKENATAYLSTDEGHPIYAVWNYGNGTVACFTRDLNGEWSSEWLDNSDAQAVILNMVETTVSITVSKDGQDKNYALTQTDPGVNKKTIPLDSSET